MWLRALADGFALELHIQPGAKRTELVGPHGDRLKVKIAAPPIEGAANQEVCSFLADLFAVPRASVRIERGLTSRQKRVVVSGTTTLPASIATLVQK